MAPNPTSPDAAPAGPTPPPAPAEAPARNAAGVAVWSQLYGDYELRNGMVEGLDLGRTTQTGGVVAGLDNVFIAPEGSSAIVLGLLGGVMSSNVNNVDGTSSKINGPSVGAYGIWIMGPFSMDGTFKADFLVVDQTELLSTSASFGLSDYSGALNLNHKLEFTGWWLEPTVGALATHTAWNGAGQALGLTDGNDFRVQGGARLGTTFDWGKAAVEATWTALAYDDVAISGGTLVATTGGAGLGMPIVTPTDQGKVFGLASAKLNLDWKDVKGLSTYAESEVRGTTGVLAFAERLGVRFAW